MAKKSASSTVVVTGKGTNVQRCTCAHPAQDRIYGSGNRLHNRGSKQSSCTSCGQKR